MDKGMSIDELRHELQETRRELKKFSSMYAQIRERLMEELAETQWILFAHSIDQAREKIENLYEEVKQFPPRSFDSILTANAPSR